jgi:Na+-translocating ferredoxin:NAD+ oxidoreductase RnfA subunit
MRQKKKPIVDSFIELQKNGNYFFDPKISIGSKLLLFIDLVLHSIIFISLAFIFSWFFDKYTVRDLDRNQNKGVVFLEIISQILLIVVTIYFIVIVIAKYIPTFYRNPPVEHLAFKSYTLTMLIIFGIFSGEYKFQEKLRFIFNDSLDRDYEILDALGVCYLNHSFPGCTP